MITKNQFKADKIYFYSDFGEKSYCKIKAIKIYKTRKNIFWFNAKIVDNAKLTGGSVGKFNANGTIHSYSNSFIYNNLKELKQGCKKYVETQVNFLKKTYNIKP